MIKLSQKVSILVLGTLVSACASEVGHPPANFGEAVNRNIEAQIANPDRLVTNKTVTSDGVRVERAQSKYQKGDTEKTETVDTMKSSKN